MQNDFFEYEVANNQDEITDNFLISSNKEIESISPNRVDDFHCPNGERHFFRLTTSGYKQCTKCGYKC